MKKSKLLALILAGCIAVSSLTACGAASGTSAGGSAPASGSASAADGVSHLKIMGTEGWAPCTDWNEVGEYSAFKPCRLAGQAKLDVEWEVITAEQYPVILQTRLASGNDLPDIVKVHTLDDAALLALAEQGLIIPINEIIDKYSAGPAREAFNKTFPSVRPLTTAEDGNMYWFCNVQNKYYGDNNDANGSFSILYRRDWADALEIDEPENLEEFTQMLRDFRTKDANGNGQQDEILFIDPSSFRTGIAQWFDLATGTIALDPQQNKIVTPWKNPNVKAYFAYLNSLVNEGILDPAVAGNYELLTQKRAENKIAAMWDYTNAMWNEPTVQAIAPDALYAPLMPLPAVDGVEPASMSEPGQMVWERYAVTKDCKDLEAVARLLDIVYSEDYATLTAFGEEGVNFTYDEEGVMVSCGLSGDELREQRIAEGAMLWNGVLPRVQSVDMRQQVATCDDYKRDVTLALIDYDKKYPDQLNNFLALPTKEESERINELQATLDTASQELATKLTLGQIPLSDLEKEVEKLDELGLSELLEIAQARYDRYLANLPS
ncbi:MAG: hypothetical protein ACLRI7_11650 [Ruthenibacterium lactatiformans]